MLSYICDHGLNGLSEENLLEMITFANAAARLVTTQKGAIKSMPDKDVGLNMTFEGIEEGVKLLNSIDYNKCREEYS